MLSRSIAPIARHAQRCARRSIGTKALNYGSQSSPLRNSWVPPFYTRCMSTPAPQITTSQLSSESYHSISDETMENLLESLESLMDQMDQPQYEVDYNSGVMTVMLGTHGTYVINKQPPNKQIWLSSPFSGPKRYDYSPTDHEWIYSRDLTSMRALLEEELSQAVGFQVQLDLRRKRRMVI